MKFIALTFFLAFGGLSLAGTASAQYTATNSANIYTSLSSPTITSTDVDDGNAEVTTPFPISFYGVSYSSLSLGYNGAILFPGGTFVSLSNATPGSATSPDAFLAPMWDDLRLYSANAGYIGSQTEGTAPNRSFTVEWHRISRFGASGMTFSMQVRFFEASERIEVDYGPIAGVASFSATMGMEDEAGANPVLFAESACTTECTVADLTALTGMRITLELPCGNGAMDVGEECDDGNTADGDGCSADCSSNEMCGNDIVDTAVMELCDDGGVADGDGCSADCMSDETCGNGIVDSAVGEVCDDTNTTDGDGCAADCSSDETCGNGVLDASLGEGCDDGNLVVGDGCTDMCQLEECGNGVVDPAEICDDGNVIDGDGCAASCVSDETCGNGVADLILEEVCDDGNLNDGDGCDATCMSDESCGNGIADTAAGEICEDGNVVDGDGCSADCSSDETCGNGIVDASAGEGCDDGNDVDGDGCQSGCRLPVCGDGILDADETCDDGNTAAGDGCGAGCALAALCGDGNLDDGELCDEGERNSDDRTDACRTTCVTPTCGDGVIDSAEACDDGTDNVDVGEVGTCTLACEVATPPGMLSTDSGCGCDTVGAGSNSKLPWLALLFFYMFVAARRRFGGSFPIVDR